MSKATIHTTDTDQTIELEASYLDAAGCAHPYDIHGDMCILIQDDEATLDDEGVWHMSGEDAEFWAAYAELAPEVYSAELALSSDGWDWDELKAMEDDCVGLDIVDSLASYLGKLRTL